jgi:hypothetical protein
MKVKRLPVLAWFAIVLLSTAVGSIRAQPVTTHHRALTSGEIQRLKRQYIKLRTELKSRRLMRTVRDVVPHPDVGFLERQYGIKEQPEFHELPDEVLHLQIHDIVEQLGIEAIIYGTDDIKEIYREPPVDTDSAIPYVRDDTVLEMSQSVVAIVDTSVLKREGEKWILETQPLAYVENGSMQLCEFDRFYNAVCTNVKGTGFLVADSVIATAGHLVQVMDSGYEKWLKSVYFVFDYVMETQGLVKTVFEDDDVYTGVAVLADHSSEGADWALVRLDRPVEGREPLKCRTEGAMPKEATLYMIGHPNGMPLKYSGPGVVLNNVPCNYFLSDLDTHPYNSGSPVFNASTHLVEGILVRDVGNFSEYCNCYATSLYSPENGLPGVEVTRSVLFTWFLERPEHIVIRSTVTLAILESGDYTACIPAGTEQMLPYCDTGILLLGNADDCWIPYYPMPGEIWQVVPGSFAGLYVMERVCE